MVTTQHLSPPQSPSTPTDNPVALTTTLQELGFNPSQSDNFEWLYSIPDARPLLSALVKTFRPEHVLSATEAQRYIALKEAHPILLEPQLSEAAAPLLHAPIRQNLSEDQSEELLAEEEYLAHLELELSVMKGVLEEDSINYSIQPGILDAEPLSELNVLPELDDPQHPLNVLLQNLEQLELLTLRHTSSSQTQSDSYLKSYIESEQREFEEIDRSRNEALRLTSLQNETAPEDDTSLNTIVDAYASTKRKQSLADTDFTRHAAVLAALGETDAKFLEMTPASLHPLIADVRRRTTAALRVYLDDVKDFAANILWDQVRSHTLSREVSELNHYVDVLQTCLSALIEQRLRLVCMERAIDLEVEEHRRVFDSLTLLTTNAEEVEEGKSSSLAAEGNSEFLCKNIRHLALKGEDGNVAKQHVSIDIFTLNALEEENFSDALDESSGLLSELRTRIGCDSAWLNLNEHPGVSAALKKLEGELASNTIVLETLLRNKKKALEAPVSSESPRPDWALVVNNLMAS